jgi:excisionase family DNA binding protein
MGEDRTGRDHAGDRPTTGRRFTVSEAAGVLGISVEAVRGRIKRGTIEHERDGGRVYVYLDADRPATGPDQTPDRPVGVELLRAQVEDLRNDRDAWRDQARRSDYMASTAMDRTRELEGRLRELEPARFSEAAESDAGPAQETPAQRAPWWRRIFGS